MAPCGAEEGHFAAGEAFDGAAARVPAGQVQGAHSHQHSSTKLKTEHQVCKLCGPSSASLLPCDATRLTRKTSKRHSTQKGRLRASGDNKRLFGCCELLTRVSKNPTTSSQHAGSAASQVGRALELEISTQRHPQSSRRRLLPVHGPASCARRAVRAAAGNPTSNLANLQSFLTAAPQAVGANPSAVVRSQRCIPAPRLWRKGSLHTPTALLYAVCPACSCSGCWGLSSLAA